VPPPVRWLLVLCVVTLLLGLGRSAVTDSDEAFYAESARQMIVSGDWLTPQYNAEVRFEKPVLMYWLIAAAYGVGGVTEAAARLPSALAGLALVLLTYAVASRWYDRATGTLAGAIVATTFGCAAMAWQALPDLPVTALITFATWALVRALSSDRRDAGTWPIDAPGHRRAWLVVAAFAAALACLTKGPIGIVLPALVVLPLACWEHRGPAGTAWHLRAPAGLTMATVAAALGVFLAVAVPWFAAMAQVHGAAYLVRFFVGENLTRFATPEFNDPRPFWFYVPILAGGLLPWTPFAVLWAPGIARAIRTRVVPQLVDLRLIVWTLAPLLFYSASVGKQPRYILPLLPPVAILLARSIREHLDARAEPRHARRLRMSAAGVVMCWLALAWLMFRGAPVLAAAGMPQPLIPATAFLGAAVVLGAAVATGRLNTAPLAVVLGGAVTLLSLHFQVLSPPRPSPVERAAATLSEAWREGHTLGTHRAFGRNQIFYSGLPRRELVTPDQVVDFLESPAPAIAVIRRRDLAPLESRIAGPLRRLDRIDYVDTAALRIGDLLHPDLESVRQRVLIVTNR
jgi:4-amino-4-deoxy-L-arabinose transferase-like glycosyltransferase|tara:strand:+ start:4153 stop:5865 length:1713 start_codon:yes stop_codon:yes gene_type:complete